MEHTITNFIFKIFDDSKYAHLFQYNNQNKCSFFDKTPILGILSIRVRIRVRVRVRVRVSVLGLGLAC